MKKLLLILILILLSGVLKAQNFCVSRTTISTAIYNNVHDITIDLKAIFPTAGVIGIRFNNCYNIRIKRSSVTGGTTMALYFYKCHDVLVDSCSFDRDGSGIVFESCTGNCKANYNQFRDMIGATPYVSHAIQFLRCTGAGNEAQHNKIQTTPNLKTGDLINVYQSFGTPTSRIKINYNWILGGGTDYSFGPAGIVLGDKFGDYQEAIGNKLVNTGYAGIQVQGGNHNVVKHDTIFSAVGLTYSGLGLKFSNAEPTNPTPAGVGDTAYQCVIRWWSGRNVPPKMRDTVYSSALGNVKPALWTSQITNASIDATILPAKIFDECLVPNIAYSTPVTYTYGTPIIPLTPVNTGGAVVSYGVSPSLPSGLSLNTTTGVISGTPTAAHAAADYVVTGTNPGGSDPFTIHMTINKAPLVIIADSKAKAQGSPNPTLTVSYYGFVLSDNAGSLTTQPTASTTAVTGSPAGLYPITASGAVSSNYSFTYIPGVLLVYPTDIGRVIHGRAARVVTY